MGKKNEASLLISVERANGKLAVECRSQSGEDNELNAIVKGLAIELLPHTHISITSYFKRQQEKEINHVTH